MDKKELVSKVAEKTDLKLSKKAIESLIETTVSVITETVKDGEKVKVNNLGSFYKKTLKGRKWSTPLLKDGTLEIDDRVTVGFKPSPTLFKTMNGKIVKE